ncbi:MAG: hypothetical protein ACI9EF_002867, partial [Pseudohongiellaceae bacterium]
ATHRGVAASCGEVLLFVDHDDELGNELLTPLARSFETNPTVDFVYTDEDQISSTGRYVAPVFKPGPSPWLGLGFNYVTHAMAVRRRLYDLLGGLRSEFDGAQDHDFMLRAFEQARGVVHLPLVGYHWRRTPGSVAASTTAKPWAFEAGRRAIEAACRRRRLPLARVLAARPTGVWHLEWQELTAPISVQVVLHGDAAGWPAWRRSLAEKNPLFHVMSWDEGSLPKSPVRAHVLCIDGALKPDLSVLQQLFGWGTLPGVLAVAAGAELGSRRTHLGYSIDRSGLAQPIEPGLPRRAVGPGLLGAAPREVATSGDHLLLLNGAFEAQLQQLAGQPLTRANLLCLGLAGATLGAPTVHLPKTGAQLSHRAGQHQQPVWLHLSPLWSSVKSQLPVDFWRNDVDRFCPRHELLTDLGIPAPITSAPTGANVVTPGRA